MATDYKALGKRISNARKQAGITQEALGEQLNMTRKHISVIESAIKRPSLDALVDIQKDAQYDTYHYFRDYHKELQTVCANVDSILETEREAQHEQQQSRKNEHFL